MPSLAGLFELADRAAGKIEIAEQISISLEHSKQAAALCEYFEQHAHRVYSCLICPEMRAARELARRIKEGRLPAPFLTRAVYTKGWSGLDNPDRARRALEILEDAGWVRRLELQTRPSGGRPSESWAINPGVRNAK
jgi:hypothetical protein